jgi:hypothetical protein
MNVEYRCVTCDDVVVANDHEHLRIGGVCLRSCIGQFYHRLNFGKECDLQTKLIGHGCVRRVPRASS